MPSQMDVAPLPYKWAGVDGWYGNLWAEAEGEGALVVRGDCCLKHGCFCGKRPNGL